MSALNEVLDIDSRMFPAATKDARVELAQLRADLQAAQERIAEQERQLAEAHSLIDQSCSDAVAIVNMSDGYVHEIAEHLANQLGAWLAANPAPESQP